MVEAKFFARAFLIGSGKMVEQNQPMKNVQAKNGLPKSANEKMREQKYANYLFVYWQFWSTKMSQSEMRDQMFVYLLFQPMRKCSTKIMLEQIIVCLLLLVCLLTIMVDLNGPMKNAWARKNGLLKSANEKMLSKKVYQQIFCWAYAMTCILASITLSFSL